MALYDNKRWLLSHIRNSFISTDDTGMCELVMSREDFAKSLCESVDVFPIVQDSDDDDDDEDDRSYDIEFDFDGGLRMRSNTALRMEKADLMKKKATKIKNVKWESSNEPCSETYLNEMFSKKTLVQNEAPQKSLLSLQLETFVPLPKNPYQEYAKFDGSAQVELPARKYKIFLTMLPEDERNYPMTISCVVTASILQLIGLICYKCSTIHGDYVSQHVTNYGLCIAEEDGEIDHDFPCLDPKEPVAKFKLYCFALVEHKNVKNVSFEVTESITFFRDDNDDTADNNSEMRDVACRDKQLMEGYKTAVEAPLYQSYTVYIISKVKIKTEIHLGISGEKLEIDPIQQKSPKFMLGRQKAVSYSMDSIACCESMDVKGNRCIFRIMYSPSFGQEKTHHSQATLHSSASFKHYDFESDYTTAEEIIQKINLILQLKSSSSRKEYLAAKERKHFRRKSSSNK